jgi:acetyltransferase-like isoleucine patch superfamily enzyme
MVELVRLKTIIKKILNKLNLHLILIEIAEEERMKKCFDGIKNGGCLFYPEAIVENFQNDKESIFIGENTHVRGELLVWRHGGKINIGMNSFVGPGTRIWSGSQEGIKIGNNVLLSHNVTIIDSDSHEIDYLQRSKSFLNLIKSGHPLVNSDVKTSSVFIDDYAWISYNVSILKGVKIGKGAIIAAGSVVTNDIPEFVMAAGNPAKVIKKLNNEIK